MLRHKPSERVTFKVEVVVFRRATDARILKDKTKIAASAPESLVLRFSGTLRRIPFRFG
jgi:hypothetical protein